LALDYKWFTIEYTSTFGAVADPARGQTKLNSLGFGLTGRKFWFRNFFQNTQGYYLQNPQYFFPDFNPSTDSYPSRADLQSFTYFANLNYGFNHRKFSNMAALWQLERQKKSAGSFTTGLTFAVASYTADSALIPPAYQELFPKSEFIEGFSLLLAGVNVGYLHTFAFGKTKKWFVSLALIPGVSYQKGLAVQADDTDSRTEEKIGLQGEARLVFGYNGDRWYTSVSSVSYAITTRFDQATPFSQGYHYARFVVGYKIKMPEHNNRFLKKIGF
jgi:hypothetical protein